MQSALRLSILIATFLVASATECYKVSAPSNSALCNAADYRMEVCSDSEGEAEDWVAGMAIIGDGNLNLEQCKRIIEPYCTVVGGTVKEQVECGPVCEMMTTGALIACDVRSPECDKDESLPPVSELLANWRSFMNRAMLNMCCTWVAGIIAASCDGVDPAKIEQIATLEIEVATNTSEPICTTASGCIGSEENPAGGQGAAASLRGSPLAAAAAVVVSSLLRVAGCV